MRLLRKLAALLLLTLAGWTHSASVPNSSTVTPTNTPQFGVNWRDQEVTVAYFTKGFISLRSDGAAHNYGLSFSYGEACVGCLRIGLWAFAGPGATYVQDTPAACITGFPSGAGHTFTFGIRGLQVYFLIDGVQAIDTCQKPALNPTGAVTYKEFRPSSQYSGAPSIQVEVGGTGTATFNYFNYATDIANHVAGQVAQGVLPEQTRFDLDARKAIVLCGEPGHFGVGQSGLQRITPLR